MKITVVLASLLVSALAAAPQAQQTPKYADSAFLQKQKDVLRLFAYINQPNQYSDFVQIANSFNYQQEGLYTNQEAVQNFTNLYQNGLVPRGQIFSVFNEQQLEQAIALFRLFYYAKDFDTFFKTAVFARNNLNEGLFLYSVSVAIVYRQDTYGIVLPPIYEIYPNYFFSNEVIQKAYQYNQQYQSGEQNTQENGFNGYTIDANYSGYYLNLNPEQSLSYFTEDVGLNSFYYYFNIYYPFWLSGQDFDLSRDRRGELFYYVNQQILARYYLERLSNGFGEIPYFNYEVPFETGYYPSLRYPNGLEFPTRPNFANLYEYFYNYGQKFNFNSRYGYSYTRVQDYERRIRDAIDQGFVLTRNGQRVDLYNGNNVNIVGNLIQSNPDSPDNTFYGPLQIYARHLLGYSYQPLDRNRVAPSALEQFETSLRDPAYYQLFKRIILNVQSYLARLPPYTKQELVFPGVRVTNVEFDRLVTFFDTFYSELTNAVYVPTQQFGNNSFQVRARQYRLNNKPFNYRIRVNSEQPQEAVVRIYLGPSVDEYDRAINISENRVNFVQFDVFRYSLAAGENVIERNSYQSQFYGNDRTSYRNLYQKVQAALNQNGQFPLDGSEAFYSFPRRLQLPRGTYGGQEYQFYVIVTPYVPYQGAQQASNPSQNYYPRVGSGQVFVDNNPRGFPFDRRIVNENFFNSVPNSYFYVTKIYNRQASDVNSAGAVQQ